MNNAFNNGRYIGKMREPPPDVKKPQNSLPRYLTRSMHETVYLRKMLGLIRLVLDSAQHGRLYSKHMLLN